MAITTKKMTLQVTFTEDEFLGRLFEVIPEGTVVTAVDVLRGSKNFPVNPVTIVVRLIQPFEE